MLGLSFDKLVVVGVIASFIIGPQRLPRYAAGLARLVSKLTQFVEKAKKQVTDEVPELADVDWTQLDPRRYDPRRIVANALADNGWTSSINDSVSGEELDTQR